MKEENYGFFFEKCEQYIPRVATSYVYSMLPNHFHILITTHLSENLRIESNETYAKRISQTFSNLFNSYTKSFNKYYKRRGALFSKNFKRTKVDSLDYRINTVLY